MAYRDNPQFSSSGKREAYQVTGTSKNHDRRSDHPQHTSLEDGHDSTPHQQAQCSCCSGSSLHQEETAAATAANSDGYVVDALTNLSLQQRDEVYHDVHGVSELINETPELLAGSVEELRVELQRLTTTTTSKDYAPFLEAERQNRSYVHSRQHYLIFLRADQFDVSAAARRMIRFFALKEEGFGSSSLCQDLQQEMLSDSDMASLKEGSWQMLPRRDQAGRVVSFIVPNLQKCADGRRTLIRVYLYVIWRMVQDEETQRRGAVAIAILMGPQTDVDPALTSMAHASLTSMPLRFAVIHNCSTDLRFSRWTQLALGLLPRNLRARIKLHYGSWQECMYKLLSYGIPVASLPIKVSSGEVKTKNFVAFLKMLHLQQQWITSGTLEESTGDDYHYDDDENERMQWKHSPKRVVAIPGTADVLLGRGQHVKIHKGNATLRGLVEEAASAYGASGQSKRQKTELSQQIVERVKVKLGGRFLQQDPRTRIWICADDREARIKVSRMLQVGQRTASSKTVKLQAEGGQLFSSSDATAPYTNHANKRLRL